MCVIFGWSYYSDFIGRSSFTFSIVLTLYLFFAYFSPSHGNYTKIHPRFGNRFTANIYIYVNTNTGSIVLLLYIGILIHRLF